VKRGLRFSPAFGFVLTRTLAAVVTVLVLASLVFFALRLLPGDPTTLLLGDESPPEARALLRARLGLDRPLWVQYAHFLSGIFSFDLGPSFARPEVGAFEEVGRALGPTATLALLAVGFGALGGMALGLLSVGPWLLRGRHAVHALMLVAGSVPLLGLAPVTTWLLAVELPILPLPGDPRHAFAGSCFAAGLLAVPLGAQVARITRASLLDQAGAKYLTAARSRGASPLRIWLLHALPVASAPIAVVIATQLGALLAGAVVLERLFERQGLGSLMLRAHAARDLSVLEASVVVAGCLFVLAQTLAAVVSALVDPRGRES